MTAVYRHFDSAGTLLYVGLSVNAAARTSAHSATAPWFDRVARVEIEAHACREDALNAEAVAIVIERPAHNQIVPLRRAMRVVTPLENWPTLRAIFYASKKATSMETASEIIEFIGQDRIMAALSVKDDAVRKAKTAGVLPASWFHTLENLAGRPLPRKAFNFKGIS